jgi:protein-L-isoaspartate(D-aspartate) O-methyltransferase
VEIIIEIADNLIKEWLNMGAKYRGLNETCLTAVKRQVCVAVLLLILLPSVVILTIGGARVSQAVFAAESKSDDTNQQAGRQKDPNERRPERPDHNHPVFKERIRERAKMVTEQIEWRDVNDPNVLKAMRIVPRHAFVRPGEQREAYADYPLPIGLGQTISQPYIVGFMTEALKLKADSKVLEIGAGSGYQAAVCAEIAQEVYTIEIVKELAESAKERLKKLGYKNVFVRAGDGYFGWQEKMPFDAIIGTAATGRIPPPLLEQLKPGGRMILPYEDAVGFQYLVLITKDEKGRIQRRNVMPVRFVPMTGQVQKGEGKSEK